MGCKIMTIKKLADLEVTRRGFLIRSSIITVVPTLLTVPGVSLANQILTPPTSRELHILNSSVGFNGQRVDPIMGIYHLGNGYRVFDPRRMVFNQGDVLSPFNDGGVNPYAYCICDPINFIDPTGQNPNVIGIVSGVIGALFNAAIIGFLISLAPFTGGMSLGAAGAMFGIASASLGIGGSVLGVAANSIDDSNPHKKNLNIASTSFNLGAMVLAIPALGTAAVSAGQTMVKAGGGLGKLAFARRVAGVTFETGNTVANAVGFGGQMTGNKALMKGADYAKIVLNGLAFGAYVPLSRKPIRYKRKEMDNTYFGAKLKTTTYLGEATSEVSRGPIVFGFKYAKEGFRTTNSIIHFSNVMNTL